MLNEYAQIAHQKFLAREREKLRADKRLRDAAPDLLAALKAMVLNDAHTYRDCHMAARAAIAKAEGTS
jgi:hypothetical protein